MGREQGWPLILAAASLETSLRSDHSACRCQLKPQQVQANPQEEWTRIGDAYLPILLLHQQIHAFVLFSAVTMINVPTLSWECCPQNKQRLRDIDGAAQSCPHPQVRGWAPASVCVVLWYPEIEWHGPGYNSWT